MKYLSNDDKIYFFCSSKNNNVIHNFLEYQKTLVSIWYSIFILAVTKSISGRKLTELPFTRVVADLAGAKYEETLCVKDGSLITAIGNPGLIKMMEEIRVAIQENRLLDYKEDFIKEYQNGKNNWKELWCCSTY